MQRTPVFPSIPPPEKLTKSQVEDDGRPARRRRNKTPKEGRQLILSVTREFAPFEYEQSQTISKMLDEMFDAHGRPFEILSTIRYDPTLSKGVPLATESFFLLGIHWQRMLFAFKFFDWNVILNFEHLVKELKATVSTLDPLKPYRMRVLVSKDGELKVEAYATPPRRDLHSGLMSQLHPADPNFRVYVDSVPVMVSPFTSFKTTLRDHYNQARSRSLPGKDPHEEVLLYNTRDEITEGSITNFAFYRQNRWVTPPLTSGCLCGVVRHYLLQLNVIIEREIRLESVMEGEKVLLFNGNIGICEGHITHVPERPKIDLDDEVTVDAESTPAPETFTPAISGTEWLNFVTFPDVASDTDTEPKTDEVEYSSFSAVNGAIDSIIFGDTELHLPESPAEGAAEIPTVLAEEPPSETLNHSPPP